MSVFPLASLPLASSYPPVGYNVSLEALIESGEGESQYLVEITAYIGGESRSGGLSTWTEIPLASTPPGSGVSTGQVTLRYADRHWIGEPTTYRFDFMTDGSLPSGATLTRASSGYDGSYIDANGVIQDAAASAPRWTYAWDDDEADFVLQGLLDEPERTNRRTYSDDPSQWTLGATSLTTDDAILGPDGQMSGDLFVDQNLGTTGQAHLQASVVLPVADYYAMSGIFKPDVQVDVYLRAVNYTASPGKLFALDTETVGGGIVPADVLDSDITKLANGWLLCTTAFDMTDYVDLVGNPRWGWADGNSVALLRDGTHTLYLFGGQFEQCADGDPRVSSFIRTNASVKTRAADVLVLDVPDGTYTVTIVRADGTTKVESQVVANGLGYTVPTSTSPLQSVTMVRASEDSATKGNVFYEGRLTDPLMIERIMPVLPEEERRVHRQFGELIIANGDGVLDPVVRSYAVDGRQVRVLFGPYMGSYSDFLLVADVVGTGWEADDLSVRLGLRDRGYNLDLPLQANLYTGAGGAEGGSEVQGKPKPLLFGRCRNVTPALIDPTNLIYQVHDGIIHALDAVYDRGAALTDSGVDVASYAALVAQSVSAGNFATAKSVGMFKLGSSPDGLVTADVRGDADPDYQNTLDQVALRVIKDRAGLDVAYVNEASFAGAAASGGEMGFYLSQNEPLTTAEVLNVLMGAEGAWWGAGRDGRIRAGRLQKPEDRTPRLYLDQYNILSLAPDPTPVPRWRQRVAYQPNWTPQRGEDIAGSVTDERRQFLAESYRVVTAADATVKVRHLQALDPVPLPSLFENSSDAETLASFLLALHSPDRQMISVAVKRLGYRVELQSVVHVTWPRLGLSNGKKFAVVGIIEDGNNDTTTLRLWG